MRKGLQIIILALSFAGMACMIQPAVGAKKKENAKIEARQKRAKAQYYYLEGVDKRIHGKAAEAYEYYRYASAVDPGYSDASYAYGQVRLINLRDTMQTRKELSKSLSMMRAFVDEYPEDYEESIYYAYVASRLDSMQEAIRVYERTDSLMPNRTTTLLHLSDVYFATGDEGKALAALDKYEKIEGKSLDLTLKKISFLLNKRDTVGAIAEATSLVESNPTEPTYRILKGNLYELIENEDSVLYYYETAEKVSPNSGYAKLALAEHYRSKGDSVSYDAKTYEALLAEDFGLEEKIGLLSEYLQYLIYDKSNTERGDYLFSVLEEQYPHEHDVLDLAARYSAAKGDFSTAIEKIGYAIDLSPTKEAYWIQKMRYQISNDDTEGSLTTYSEAVKHIPASYELMGICASGAMIGENYDKALEMYQKMMNEIISIEDMTAPLSLKHLPSTITYEDLETLSSLYSTAGDCYYNKHQLEETFKLYDNALLLNPDNSMALNNYAYFLVENGGDIDKAERMSLKSLSGDNSENPTFLDTYAWILYKKGEYSEALKYQIKAIEKSVSTHTESEELYDHYGDILMADGDKAGAISAWEKALELSPEDTEIKNKINEAK